MAKKKGKGRPRGANLEALRQAATSAAVRPRRARRPRDLVSPLVIRDKKNAAKEIERHLDILGTPPLTGAFNPFVSEPLKPKPRQKTLQFEKSRKVPLRTVSSAALATPQSKRKRMDRRPGLYEALCAEYRADKQKRRESMFASGSAGKGRRNSGKRTPDWRAKYC